MFAREGRMYRNGHRNQFPLRSMTVSEAEQWDCGSETAVAEVLSEQLQMSEPKSQARRGSLRGLAAEPPRKKKGRITMRIGNGYDVHRLVEGRPLILGGEQIEHTLGLLGHSDADVLVHAIMDALLGAVALGDIGTHFPDTDPKYKGISSIRLLEHVRELLADYEICNIDSIIVAQKPKLAGYLPAMRENIASALEIPVGRVSIKATTTEQLGFEGKEEGISSYAVCLLQEK